jgi:hypothetical protein
MPLFLSASNFSELEGKPCCSPVHDAGVVYVEPRTLASAGDSEPANPHVAGPPTQHPPVPGEQRRAGEAASGIEGAGGEPDEILVGSNVSDNRVLDAKDAIVILLPPITR